MDLPPAPQMPDAPYRVSPEDVENKALLASGLLCLVLLQARPYHGQAKTVVERDEIEKRKLREAREKLQKQVRLSGWSHGCGCLYVAVVFVSRECRRRRKP